MPPSRRGGGSGPGPGASSYLATDADILEYLSPDDEAAIREQDLAEEPSREEQLAYEVSKSVVLDNVPKTTKDKVDKLRQRLLELVTQFDPDGKERMDVDLAVDPATGASLGFAFVTTESDETAKRILEHLDGYRMGQNELRVFPFADLERYENTPQTFEAPAPRAYHEPLDLGAWLEDGREQFVIRRDEETEVHWCDGLALGATTDVAYAGEREKKAGKAWCKMYVQWSPKGSYLATFHEQGIKLWGGPSFMERPDLRFPHRGVSHASFSPCERYMVTWNGSDSGSDPNALLVWEVKTARMARAFKVSEGAVWPMFKWAGSGNHVARAIEDGVSLFEMPSMRLVGKPIPATGIVSFEWSPSPSPKDEVLAYWAPEENINVPARVVLLDPLTRREVRSKNLFNVQDVTLHWSPDRGDFLCAQVLRHTKTKKTTFTNFEIFRMRDPDIPNETYQMNEAVTFFSFEPTPAVPLPGATTPAVTAPPRFGVIHASTDGKSTEVSFFSLGAIRGGNKIEKVVTLPARSASQLRWSPMGSLVVIAHPGASGSLEFYDVDEKQTLAQVEHFNCTDVAWDPSGRFVVSAVSQPMFGAVGARQMQENGFRIYNFMGQKLRDVGFSRFFQFLWRPRPAPLLADKAVDDVRKRLPALVKRHMADADKRIELLELAKNKERIAALAEFRAILADRHRDFLKHQELRKERGIRWIPATAVHQGSTSPAAVAEASIAIEYVDVAEAVEEVISEKVERVI